MSGDRLPNPTPPFAGTVGRLINESEAVPLQGLRSPAGAPNVVLILLDDVGFGTCSTFGGPVPTPTVDRVARAGLRYNQFHTTALCSPTRAAECAAGAEADVIEQDQDDVGGIGWRPESLKGNGLGLVEEPAHGAGERRRRVR